MNPNTIRRLVALERIRTGVSPSCGKVRSHEEVATLLTDVYASVWNDGATLQPREILYAENLRLVEEWRTLSLTAKLEKYSGLFNEI